MIEAPSKPATTIYNIKERPYAAFFDACKRGDIDTVNQCYAEGIVLSQPEPYTDCTGLILACLNGHLPLVKHFYEELNVESNDDFYDLDDTFFSAYKSGNMDLVRYLSSKGQENPHDFERAFKNACIQGHVAMVRYFLEEKKEYQLLKLDNKEYCNQILTSALRSGNVNLVIYLCEEKGVNLSWLTPEEIFTEACYSGNLELIKYLYETKNIKPSQKIEISYAAFKSGNLDVLRYSNEVLGCKIDIPPRNENFYEYEFYSRFLNLEFLQFIFKKLGEVKKLREFENDLLIAENCPLSVVRYLCEERGHPIDDDLLLASGGMPLDAVKYLFMKHPDISSAMRRVGAKLLENALCYFNMEVIEHLCTVYNIKLKTVIGNYENALFYIAERLKKGPRAQDFEMVKYLCEVQQFDVNDTLAYEPQDTVLHAFSSVSCCGPDLIRYLWQKVSNPHVANKLGETVVIVCALSGNPEQLPLFKSLGADLITTDLEGNNAILCLDDPCPDSNADYYIKICAYLYKHGVDITQANKDNCTGLEGVKCAFVALENEGFEPILRYPIFCKYFIFEYIASDCLKDNTSPLTTSFACFMAAVFALREGPSDESQKNAFKFFRASFEVNKELFLELMKKCVENREKYYELSATAIHCLLSFTAKQLLAKHDENTLQSLSYMCFDKSAALLHDDKKAFEEMVTFSLLFIGIIRKKHVDEEIGEFVPNTLITTPHDDEFEKVFCVFLKTKIMPLSKLIEEHPGTILKKLSIFKTQFSDVFNGNVTIFQDIQQLCYVSCAAMEDEYWQLKAEKEKCNQMKNNDASNKRERNEEENQAVKIQQFGLIQSQTSDNADIADKTELKKIKNEPPDEAKKFDVSNESLARFN